MTLKDIAEKAGVSMMTVSNVINKKTNRVSPQTAARINAIIKESGYVPNLSARSLTNRKTNIIGVIITWHEPEPEINFLENPYMSSMVGTAQSGLLHSCPFYLQPVRSVCITEELERGRDHFSVPEL